ncbi:endonuclease/exonuclease/phosphatase family protein [Brachybacterium sacelli]|uniref:Vancomycin resistance protein VanJ n=1 Tax=Brachybacterium sacelli TaxID=173364 RepID=A0ABS4WYS8_9MICO|nr:endonuclease/exonuclease/phosphatase family protein [Brachybacterium sacelli]MBP2381364.1 vancomycin resistance protein VanJ [Brachybacterium sacelli]
MESAPPSQAPSPDVQPAPAPVPARSPGWRGLVVIGLAVVMLALIVSNWVPGVVGTIGSVLLPWLVIPLVLTLVIALWTARRSAAALLVPALVWGVAMAPALPHPGPDAGDESMVVIAQNVRAESGTAAESARAAVEAGAAVIALTELDADSRDAARAALDEAYPYQYGVGTEGVWSQYPLGEGEPLSLGLGWKRAARVTVEAPAGDVALYLVHAASVRLGEQEGRDTMLSEVADVVAADSSERILVVGDFNAAPTDPALRPLRAAADWVRPTGISPGFTWPAEAPVARIDHVFVSGLDVTSATSFRAGQSDHLATRTALTFPA